MEVALPARPWGYCSTRGRRVNAHRFPGRPDPASSPERCTIAWRQRYPVVGAGCNSRGGEKHGCAPSVPGRPGPRLLAGAMHVAWRQRYPGDRTGRCCVLGKGVSAPSSSAETRTPPPRRGGARSVHAALLGRPCGKQFRRVACRYARTVCDGDRRVGSIHFPSVPDPASRRSDARSVESALPGRPCGTLLCDGDRRVGSILIPRVPDPTSSPERCTMRGGGITRATVREAVSCGCVQVCTTREVGPVVGPASPFRLCGMHGR